MKIRIAEYCGFCYGVKRAVDMAYKLAEANEASGTLGPLIHNPQLIEDLNTKGVPCCESLDEFQAGETVVFRSHGVGPDVYEAAHAKNLTILDATCPNVKAAQKKGQALAEAGYLPVIIGEKNHPEVKSIVQWAGKHAIVIECIKDIGNVPLADKYGVLIQTTFELAKFEEILAALQKERSGEYKIEKTICLATSQRQKAALKLADEVDAFVVIGGRNSANTRHLYELVAEHCKRAYHIETASELNEEMFKNCQNIGITAGASTPDRIIKEAIRVMENMESFESMLEQSLEDAHVYPGKIVKATVIQIGKDEVHVDFGYMKEGAIAFSQWSNEAPEILAQTIKIGDEVEAKVIPGTSKDDFIRLSKIKAEQDAAWNYVADLAEGEKRRATVKVLRIIKNKMKNIVGLAVAVEGVEGFMPASHVELRRVEDFSDYIGKELEAEVIEVDTAKKRLVVSRRDLLRSEKEAKAQAWRDAKEARIQAAKEARTAAEEAAYASVEEGQTVTGKVVRIADFGLFVEVGQGLVGLVHNTELSWDRNVKAEDAAKVDDEVTVLVKKIDRENRRVALSIKATQEDPWLTEAVAFKEGMVVEGTVERFLPFGAIVKLADKVEGLVHVSEIAETRVEKPEDILEIGQNVKVKVIKVDLKHKKIGLSIVKAVKEAEKAEYSSFINDKPELTLDLKEQLEGLNN